MAESIQFTCPNCNAYRMVAEYLVGHEIRCPECDYLIHISKKPAQQSDDFPPEEGHSKFSSSKEYETDEAASISFSSLTRAGEAEMDMTPMVDVTFLLLIFFMVTATFAMQQSIPMPTPQESEPSTQVRTLDDYVDDEDYVVVRIDAYSTYHVYANDWDKEAPSAHELLIQLRRARTPVGGAAVPNRLLVVANGEALFEKVVTALDSGTEVGMEEVQLITVEEDDE